MATTRAGSFGRSTVAVVAVSALALTFTALEAFPAEADPGTYTPSPSPSATCEVTVCSNYFPAGDDSATTPANTAVSIDGLANDCHSTLAGNTRTFTFSGNAIEATAWDAGLHTASPTDPHYAGSVAVSADQIIYTPRPASTASRSSTTTGVRQGPNSTRPPGYRSPRHAAPTNPVDNTTWSPSRLGRDRCPLARSAAYPPQGCLDPRPSVAATRPRNATVDMAKAGIRLIPRPGISSIASRT
ncbi:MAG: hypothetical protein JWN95_492 [Frankiales bacterium]|nr:hypothetical protein [Frankiales bacterium]